MQILENQQRTNMSGSHAPAGSVQGGIALKSKLISHTTVGAAAVDAVLGDCPAAAASESVRRVTAGAKTERADVRTKQTDEQLRRRSRWAWLTAGVTAVATAASATVALGTVVGRALANVVTLSNTSPSLAWPIATAVLFLTLVTATGVAIHADLSREKD